MNTLLDSTKAPIGLIRTIKHVALSNRNKLSDFESLYTVLNMFCISDSLRTITRRREVLEYCLDLMNIPIFEPFKREIILNSTKYIIPGTFPWQDYNLKKLQHYEKVFLILTATVLQTIDASSDDVLTSHLMEELIINIGEPNQYDQIKDLKENGYAYFEANKEISSIYFLDKKRDFNYNIFKNKNSVFDDLDIPYNNFVRVLQLLIQTPNKQHYECRIQNLNTLLASWWPERYQPSKIETLISYESRFYTIEQIKLNNFHMRKAWTLELLCSIAFITMSTGVTVEDELLFLFFFYLCNGDSMVFLNRMIVMGTV